VISVVKVGGAAAGAAPKIADLRRAGRQVVVVHGAGPQISERCRAIGIEPRFLAGQRLTDAAVLAVVDQALAEVNARLVAELAGAGIAAQGLFGALDGVPHDDRRLGLVGRVSRVDTAAVGELLVAGTVPVISPLAGGLNVNGDHAAAAVAAAVGASELVFLSDVPGVLGADGRVIRRITADQAPALIDGGHVTGGMIPKLNAGTAALAHGVWRVWIGAETMVTA